MRRKKITVTALAVIASLFTGACMSDINEPLPRKSQADSLAWAKQYTSSMAHYADVEISGDPAPRKHTYICKGENGEEADDGRYTMTYAAYAKLPEDQHIRAIRKLRKALEAHGVRITSHDEFPETNEGAVMYGRGDKEGYFLIADSVKPPGTIRLSVSTPCFLPPGVEQQQF